MRVAAVSAFLLTPALATATPEQSATPAGQEHRMPGPAEAAGAALGAPVVPPGQEELLGAMLGKGATLPDGCKMTGGEVDYTVVRGTYQCPGGEVVIELTHPSKASGAATRTERFAITVRSGSPPAGLMPALVSLIRSREASFEWKFLAVAPQRSSARRVVLVAVGLLAVAALAWALRRRSSSGSRQPQ
jgi:hypothetical protein